MFSVQAAVSQLAGKRYICLIGLIRFIGSF